MTWITNPSMNSLADNSVDDIWRCNYCAESVRGRFPDDWHELWTRTERTHICPGHLVFVDGEQLLAMNRPKPEGA